jgi:tRNA(Ile)-lysidine synthase
MAARMKNKQRKVIVAVSGGPDSVYLLHRSLALPGSLIVGHVNHRARGEDSDEDMRFVVRMAHDLGVTVRIHDVGPGTGTAGKETAPPGFEEKARAVRRSFLERLKEISGAEAILLGHTADDQIETVLMRVFEGAGVAGLKGIPRRTNEGIERPLLDTWREEILADLAGRGIPYRTDKSNYDTRYERNWVRHILLPLLEERYGPGVRKRLHALGERLREIDGYLDLSARRWIRRHVRPHAQGNESVAFRRKTYAKLPKALRARILQTLCLERRGIAPKERLIVGMDTLILKGGPSARIRTGKGMVLGCRYEDAVLGAEPAGEPHGTRTGALRADGPGAYPIGGPEGRVLVWDEGKAVPQRRLRTLAKGERAAAFDAAAVRMPLTVRPLRAGDRIRPFGMAASKKVKEVLIDRKVPREERWGRPVVCDAAGDILWIPGVARSDHAPVTGGTCRVMILRLVPPGTPV